MKYLIAATFALLSSGAAHAQGSACAALSKDYATTSKVLALVEAQGLGDNSAARETNRDLDRAYQLHLAEIDLGLLRDNKCPMPKEAPSSGPYIIQAIACDKQRNAGASGDIAECRINDWTPKP